MYAHPLPAVENLFKHIGLGEIEQARASLTGIRFDGRPGARTRVHYESQILMAEGRHRDAALALRAASLEYGPYAGLRVDLATCYHRLGNYQLVRKELVELEAVLLNEDSAISPERRGRYGAWLAKHLEAEGELPRALEILVQLRARAEANFERKNRLPLLVQELRLRSLLAPEPSLAELYALLLDEPAADLPPPLRAERTHALLLAETQLFGSAHGLVRWQEFLGSPVSGASDYNFCFADFLSALCLRGERALAASTLAVHPSDLSATAFGAVLSAALEIGAAASLSVMATRSHELCCNERLVLLLVILRSGEVAPEEVRRKFDFTSGTLSPEARHAWKRIAEAPSSSDGCLNYAVIEEAAALGGRRLATGPRDTVRLVLEALMERPSIPTPELGAKVWGRWQESHLPRLRMLAKRLNEEVAAYAPGAPLLQVRKDQTRLGRSLRKIARGNGREK